MIRRTHCIMLGATVLVVSPPGYSQDQVATLVPSDVDDGDMSGYSVSISGTTGVTGSWRATISTLDNAGAAHVFEEVSGSWVEIVKLDLGEFAERLLRPVRRHQRRRCPRRRPVSRRRRQ